MKKLKTALWWLLIGWWWVIVKQILLLPVRLVGYGWLWGENKCQRLLREAYEKLTSSFENRAWVRGFPSDTYLVGIEGGCSLRKARKAVKNIRKILVVSGKSTDKEVLAVHFSEGKLVCIRVPSECGEYAQKVLQKAGFFSPHSANLERYDYHTYCIFLMTNSILCPNVTIY